MSNKIFFASHALWRFASLTGVIATIVYIIHEAAGRLAWPQYNAFSQPVSDLTATGAPSQWIAQAFASVYGVLAIVFACAAIYYFKKIHPVNTVFYTGITLQLIVAVVSLFGFALFPLGGSDAQTAIHYGLAMVVVLASITSVICMVIGLNKTRQHPRMLKLLLVLAIIFIASGFLAVIAAKQVPTYAGLIERVNLYTLQIIYSSLSVWMFIKRDNKTN